MANPEQLPRPTELAHLLLQRFLREGDQVIDATAGNGHDTLFLAAQVGRSGRVLAFDVQQEAIESSRRLLESEGLAGGVEFFLESHARLAGHAGPGSIAAVMFNLGYLPGSDQSVITTRGETLAALEASLSVLRPGGWLCVVCYPGHDGGGDEAQAVESWMAERGEELRVARYGMIATRRPAPFLLIAVKRAVG